MLKDEVVRFFQRQHLTVVTTIDRNGFPHNSCKGIVDIDRNGRVYLLDLYKAKTFQNLKRNPHISVAGMDEHRFKGYCLKGKAKIMKEGRLGPRLIKAWDKRIAGRITQRLLKEVRGEKGHRHQPEAIMPNPKYLILVDVKEVINLTPKHIIKYKV